MPGSPTMLRTSADSNEFSYPSGNNFAFPKYFSGVSVGKFWTFFVNRKLYININIRLLLSAESTVSSLSAESPIRPTASCDHDFCSFVSTEQLVAASCKRKSKKNTTSLK